MKNNNYTLKDIACGRCQYCGSSADMDCDCESFLNNVEKTKTCWLYKYTELCNNKNSYGMFYSKNYKKGILAHRFSYQLFKGPLKKNKVIDHLCRNRLCVNPEHLEQVTNKENILRGMGAPAINARRTHCKNNHLLKGSHIRIYKNKRICRICEKIYNKLVRKHEKKSTV